MRIALLPASLALFAVLACSSEDLPEPEPPATTTTTSTPAPEPDVTVVGGHAVGVGKTLQLKAKTADGTDAGYSWQSKDEKTATVHNLKYMLQLLIDSMDDLEPGASTAAGFARP